MDYLSRQDFLWAVRFPFTLPLPCRKTALPSQIFHIFCLLVVGTRNDNRTGFYFICLFRVAILTAQGAIRLCEIQTDLKNAGSEKHGAKGGTRTPTVLPA